MSIVRDLLLILFFLFVIIKYLFLQKEMIQQRKYFIDILSHDLRVSAIAQIRGVELLKKAQNLNLELLENLDESCQFSLEMINMLLNSYKYQAGEKFLKFEYFSPRELVNQIHNEFSQKANEKEVKIFFDLDNKTRLYAEKAGVHKVLRILLSTAVLNSHNKTLIYVKLTNNSKGLKTTITYKGKALSKEECKRMFYKNPRFSNVGQGIKMHLAKKIIDYHNGEIKVQRLHDEISSFSFTIPKEKREINTIAQTLSMFTPNFFVKCVKTP